MESDGEKKSSKKENQDLTALIKYMAKALGASSVGIANKETLKGGPKSTDLESVLDNAKSALVFAVPLDQDLIEPYLCKKDFELNNNKIKTTTFAGGIALEIAGFLDQLGYESVPVNPNFFYRKDTPNGIKDMKPVVSHRYLAARSGVGFFGHSGHILTKEHGPAIVLASVVTTAELEPTEPFSESENYCDNCNICSASCIPKFIPKKGKTKVEIGGMEFEYSEKGDKSRCTFVCAGMSGLHSSKKWSTWSSARFEIPQNDEDFGPMIFKTLPAYIQRPKGKAVFFMPHLPGHIMEYSCSNCQFICHPNKELRKKRYEMLINSGVIVEDENGNRRAVTPEEAENLVENMPKDRKKLYTN
jgi:epoxyqueuosine reductase